MTRRRRDYLVLAAGVAAFAAALIVARVVAWRDSGTQDRMPPQQLYQHLLTTDVMREELPAGFAAAQVVASAPDPGGTPKGIVGSVDINLSRAAGDPAPTTGTRDIVTYRVYDSASGALAQVRASQPGTSPAAGTDLVKTCVLAETFGPDGAFVFCMATSGSTVVIVRTPSWDDRSGLCAFALAHLHRIEGGSSS